MTIESEAETLTSLRDIDLTDTAILRITGEGELVVLTSDALRHYLVGAWDEGRSATTEDRNPYHATEES